MSDGLERIVIYDVRDPHTNVWDMGNGPCRQYVRGDKLTDLNPGGSAWLVLSVERAASCVRVNVERVS